MFNKFVLWTAQALTLFIQRLPTMSAAASQLLQEYIEKWKIQQEANKTKAIESKLAYTHTVNYYMSCKILLVLCFSPQPFSFSTPMFIRFFLLFVFRILLSILCFPILPSIYLFFEEKKSYTVHKNICFLFYSTLFSFVRSNTTHMDRLVSFENNINSTKCLAVCLSMNINNRMIDCVLLACVRVYARAFNQWAVYFLKC